MIVWKLLYDAAGYKIQSKILILEMFICENYCLTMPTKIFSEFYSYCMP